MVIKLVMFCHYHPVKILAENHVLKLKNPWYFSKKKLSYLVLIKGSCVHLIVTKMTGNIVEALPPVNGVRACITLGEISCLHYSES